MDLSNATQNLNARRRPRMDRMMPRPSLTHDNVFLSATEPAMSVRYELDFTIGQLQQLMRQSINDLTR